MMTKEGSKAAKKRRMTPQMEGSMLHIHGTPAIVMTPQMIVQAAAQDIRSLAHNVSRDLERKEIIKKGGNLKLLEEKRALAFLPKHVKGCKTAAEVIDVAIKCAHEAVGKTEVANRFRLYNSPDLLRQALEIARAQP